MARLGRALVGMTWLLASFAAACGQEAGSATGAPVACAQVGGCAGEAKGEAPAAPWSEPAATRVCGDGVVSEGEQCDDGGTESGDRCSATCQAEKVTALVAGGDHTCARLHDGRIKCWGYSYFGQLGLGERECRGLQPGQMGSDLPPVDLGGGRAAAALVAGADHTCALLDDGGIKCWGDNDYGQLGLGDWACRGDGPDQMGPSLPEVDLGTGMKAAAIAAGADHTCALLDDGGVKCWGANDHGRLGLGDTEDRGAGPDQMGDSLPLVDLGTGRAAKAITAGAGHTCALLDDGRVKCWGQNVYGQLGLSDTLRRGVEPDQMGDNLPEVDLGTGRTATAIAASGWHTCALLDDGRVKCWGDNTHGELGLGDTAARGAGPDQMGDNLPAVSLGAGRAAKAIAAGTQHTCALLDDGRVKCWGDNQYGQLGLGDTKAHGAGPDQMGESLPAVNLGPGRTAMAIAAGSDHTCALLDDGSVRCWGYNGHGQLGLGDSEDRGDGPGEMGEALPVVTLYAGAW